MNRTECARDNLQESPAGEVTALLRQCNDGNFEVRDRLISLVYPELRRLAEHHMRAERPGHTLQTTALINEFFLEMSRRDGQIWNNRSHFLAAASQAMRRLLIDHARARNASKRGGGGRIELDLTDLPAIAGSAGLLEMNEMLDRLAAEEPRMAQVVEMRCFGGLTCADIAEALGISERTAKRDWRVAKAWLSSQLRRHSSRVP